MTRSQLRVRAEFVLAFRESRYRPTFERLGLCVRNDGNPHMPLTKERIRQLFWREHRYRREAAVTDMVTP